MVELGAACFEVTFEALGNPPGAVAPPAKRRQLVPEVGPGIRISLSSPAGARRVRTATRQLECERLPAEVGAEPIQADARERSARSSAAPVAQIYEGRLE